MRGAPGPVVIVGPFVPQADGIAVHVEHLVGALDGEARAAVLTRRGGGGDRPGGPPVLALLSASPGCLPGVARGLEAIGPEIIHFQYNLPSLGLSWLWAVVAAVRQRRRSGARLIFTLHEVRRDLDLLGPLGLVLLAALGRVSDGIVVYTSEARDLLVRRCRVPAGKITVMPHGAPAAYPPPAPAEVACLFARYGLTAGPIVFFGFLHPDKGVEHLVDAIAELRGDRPELLEGRAVLVAGSVRPRTGAFVWFERKDRAYEAMLHRRVHDLGLAGVVRFVGHVPADEVPTLLGSAAVAVLPYRNTTQSGVLNLLLAAHTPTVASQLPGLAETIGDAALFAPVGDAGRLAAQIARVLEDDGLRDALAAKMAAVHHDVSFASVARLLVTLYDATAGQPRDVTRVWRKAGVERVPKGPA